MRKTAAVLLATGILTSALLSAQSKPVDVGRLTFDVVSVKPHKTGDSGA